MHRAVVDSYIPESLDVSSMAELIISRADMKVCAFFHHLQPNKRSDCGLIPGAAARGAPRRLGPASTAKLWWVSARSTGGVAGALGCSHPLAAMRELAKPVKLH